MPPYLGWPAIGVVVGATGFVGVVVGVIGDVGVTDWLPLQAPSSSEDTISTTASSPKSNFFIGLPPRREFLYIIVDMFNNVNMFDHHFTSEMTNISIFSSTRCQYYRDDVTICN